MALACTLLMSPLSAIEWRTFEGVAHGYPVMRDLDGRPMADGDFTQWFVGEHVHARIAYQFPGGRRVIEEVTFRQRPELAQEAWAFRDMQGTQVTRAFSIDFNTGKATAMKVVKGETVTLKGIGFTPKPQIVSTEISFAGRDRLRMAGRTIDAERFVVHPKIPAIAKLFVKVPDGAIWLTTPPAGFLRWEGAMAEPDDQLIRVDLLPGGASEAAAPMATTGTRR